MLFLIVELSIEVLSFFQINSSSDDIQTYVLLPYTPLIISVIGRCQISFSIKIIKVPHCFYLPPILKAPSLDPS